MPVVGANDAEAAQAVGVNRVTVSFGLTWQKELESGGFLVGDEVKVLVDVSAVKAN